MLNRSMFVAVKKEVELNKATLVAITKTKPIEVIKKMYDLGHRDFGENRVGELLEKRAALPADIRWHFIGHLQRNKVKSIAPFIYLIHSGDSPRLLREIDKQAAGENRVIPVLLQFHIAEEEAKYGLDPEHPRQVFAEQPWRELENISIRGVMGMATYTDVDEDIAAEFATLRSTFETLQALEFPDEPLFQEISMGMSGDYPIALQHGSTMVRVGSLLYQLG